MKGDRAYAVEAANTHVLALGRNDIQFQRAISKFDLLCPDGMPLVWALNSKVPKSERLNDRVYGPTLMLEAFKRSSNQELSHFVLGGKEENLQKLKQNFSEKYPDAKLAGTGPIVRFAREVPVAKAVN
ncbi:WecB/TagA/CpsF family glycosyltransferase [Roseibacillus persicicus]|nr:WecB/TagA/CpsF family glycosyltransferase [Roseibacillus persicicus]